MKKIIVLIIILLLVCLYVIIGCPLAKKKRGNEVLTIVATTSIIADSVKKIVGNCALVRGLMGPGIDPHLYRARESDVHTLASADIVFYNGLYLEGKMGTVLQGMQRFTKSVAVSDGIDKNRLRKADFEGLYDPHIWFDVTLWIMVVMYITHHIIAIDPENATEYKKNSDSYIDDLKKLDQYVKLCVASIDPERRILVTAHDAFGYFGDAYGFKVVGLQGLSTDSEISTRDIQKLATFIVVHKIPVIFVESSIPQRTLVAVKNAVAAQGWNVTIGDELYSDALGGHTSLASTYNEMITYNINSIISGLH